MISFEIDIINFTVDKDTNFLEIGKNELLLTDIFTFETYTNNKVIFIHADFEKCEIKNNKALFGLVNICDELEYMNMSIENLNRYNDITDFMKRLKIFEKNPEIISVPVKPKKQNKPTHYVNDGDRVTRVEDWELTALHLELMDFSIKNAIDIALLNKDEEAFNRLMEGDF